MKIILIKTNKEITSRLARMARQERVTINSVVNAATPGFRCAQRLVLIQRVMGLAWMGSYSRARRRSSANPADQSGAVSARSRRIRMSKGCSKSKSIVTNSSNSRSILSPTKTSNVEGDGSLM